MHPADALTERLGLPIRDRDLLAQALVHSSWLHEHPDAARGHNERLEFLGDAVVSLAVSEALYLRHPADDEGVLSARRAAIVSTPGLARLAVRLDLGSLMFLGEGEAQRGGRVRPSLLASAFEALVGAIYLDLGWDAARDWIHRLAAEELAADSTLSTLKSPKSRLQEHTQRTTGDRPQYRLLEAVGPDHEKQFRIEVVVDGRVLGVGEGPSRRIAETSAAAEALDALRAERQAARAAKAATGTAGRGAGLRSDQRDVSAPARLLALRVQGFKSFAERTLVEFGPGISAVVGPNGSGKSNLADALRWALGEQGRSLRIRKSEDVIWAGSERRSAQGMADVTLVLENGDALLPVEYAVVELGRRLYRSGENDYLLNRQRVRLRDLQDLLDAANIAENAFLFIGQGMVDQALALRPEERRPLFEEVAGVRRHERRRRKAEDQLAEAEANLARVEDILAELRPQARRLGQLAEQQATRLTAGEELAAALIAAAHGRWHEAAGRAAEADRRRDALRLETERSLEALEAAESSVAGIATSMAERAEQERERRRGARGRAGRTHLARAARGAGDGRDRRSGAGPATDRGRARRRRRRRGGPAAHPGGAGARSGTRSSRPRWATRTGRSPRRWPSSAPCARRRGPAATSWRRCGVPSRRAPRRPRRPAGATRTHCDGRPMSGRMPPRPRAGAPGWKRPCRRHGRRSKRRRRRRPRQSPRARRRARRRTRRRAPAARWPNDPPGPGRCSRGPAGAWSSSPAAWRRRRIAGSPAPRGSSAASGWTRTSASSRRSGRPWRRPWETSPAPTSWSGEARPSLAGERGHVVVRERLATAEKVAGGGTAGELRRLDDALATVAGGRLTEAVRRDPNGAVRALLGRAVWTPDLAAALEVQAVLPVGWLAVTRDGSAVVDAFTVRVGRGDSPLERRAEADRLAREAAALETEAEAAEHATKAATTAAAEARERLEAARVAESAAAARRRRAEDTERSAGRELEAAAREAAWHAAQADRLALEMDRAAAALAAMDARPVTDAPTGEAAAGEQEAIAAWESRVAELRERRDRVAGDVAAHERTRREVEARRARAEAAITLGEGRIAASEARPGGARRARAGGGRRARRRGRRARGRGIPGGTGPRRARGAARRRPRRADPPRRGRARRDGRPGAPALGR